ncbi:MAG: 3-keto-5-aminohexanoate cleavage protein, partial [Catenulispora sp.]
MHFHDDALFPEAQDKLVITVAPYGPEWEVSDFPEDLPLTMDQHVQAAVDCYNAGASVLHIHVRDLDGKGSKKLSQFNELLGRLRDAVPDMILQ